MKRLASISIILLLTVCVLPLAPTKATALGNYSYTFPTMKFTVSPFGELFQLEAPLGYEHIAVGTWLEGYLVSYGAGEGSFLGYSYYESDQNDVYVSSGVMSDTSTKVIIATATLYGSILVEQYFIASKTMPNIGIKMVITNVGEVPVTNVLVKRAVDFDVDTGGSHGWADYDNSFAFFAALNMPYAYTSSGQDGWSPGDQTHYLGFIAMPRIAADSLDGWGSYQEAATTGATNSYFGDGLASVSWNLGTLVPGQYHVLYVAYGEGSNLGMMMANCKVAYGNALLYSGIHLPIE